MEAILDNQTQDMSENRGNKTRFARRLVYTVSAQLVGLPFFKCDEMRLLWVFTVQTAVILLKTIFEFMFNRARINFIQVAPVEVLGERVLIIQFICGLVVTILPGVSNVPSLMSGRTFFSLLLFYFFFFFSFSLLLSYCSFALFCSYN